MDTNFVKFGEKEKIMIPPKVEGFIYEDTGIRAKQLFPITLYNKEVVEFIKKGEYLKNTRLISEIEKDQEQRFDIITKKDRSVQSSLLQNLDKFLSECWARYFEYISWRQTNYLSHNVIDEENMKNYMHVQIIREAKTIRTILDGLIELVGMRRSIFELRGRTYEEYVEDIEAFDGDMRIDAHASLLTLAGAIIAGKKEHKTARVGMPRSQAGYAGILPDQKPTVEQVVW